MSAVYASLVVDYRLLCVLLYIELAMEVEDWDHAETDQEGADNTSLRSGGSIISSQSSRIMVNPLEFRITASQYSGVGYLLGIFILLAQFTVALQFVRDDQQAAVGHWVNVFGIVADILVIVQGAVLVRLARCTDEETTWREATSKGAHIMVTLMGVVGVVFWIIRSSLTCIMATRMISHGPTFNYLCWISTTNIVRTTGVIFQLFFYFRIAPSTGLRVEICERSISHLLLPLMMLCQLSVFVNTVIDSYSYVVETFVDEVGLNAVTSVAYKVGEPLHLGFCLHIFFHLMVVNNNLRRCMQHFVPSFPVVYDRTINDLDDDGDDVDDEMNNEREQLLLADSKFRFTV